MNCVPIDFVIMNMGSKTSSPIIFGKNFFENQMRFIDPNERNEVFVCHKRYMEQFPRNEMSPRQKLPHDIYLS
jgi:hypothetical protein